MGDGEVTTIYSSSVVAPEKPSEDKPQVIPLHGLRASPLDEIATFEIGSFLEIGPNAWARFPHRHTFYEIAYVARGEGTHVIDFENYQVTPPCIFILSPGQTHFWSLTPPFDGIIVSFKDELFLSGNFNEKFLSEILFFPGLGDNPQLKLNDDQAAEFLWLFRELQREFDFQEQDSSPLINAYMQVVLIKLQRLYGARVKDTFTGSAYSLVRQFTRLVTESFRTEQRVQFYADRIGISPGHLSDKVREVLGLTPSQIIRNTLILEAKRLLTNTDMTIAQISEFLSFEDPSYFCRYFKRESGMTAETFRQLIRKKYHLV